MPVEKILRAYMDETTEEEIVEEETVEPVKIDISNNLQESISAEVKEEIKKAADAIKSGVDNTAKVFEEKKEGQLKLEIEETIKDLENKLQIEKEPVKSTVIIDTETTPLFPTPDVKTNTITFNDTDTVVNYNRNLSPTNNPPAEEIVAPKTIDRLEKISQIRNEQRKIDEAEDDDEDKLTIFSETPSLKLDALDVQILDNSLLLKSPPVLTGVETL